jgi:hypothetical protein
MQIRWCCDRPAPSMVSRSKGVKWIGLGIARVRGRIAASSRDEQMLALGSEAASQIASYVQCKSVFTLAMFLEVIAQPSVRQS